MEKFGYYLPWVLGGSALTAVSYGLLSTLYTGTSRAHWVGFEFLFGAGCGAAFSGVSILIILSPENFANGCIFFPVLYSCPKFYSLIRNTHGYGNSGFRAELWRRVVADDSAVHVHKYTERAS